MLIARIARVRHLVLGAVGELVIFKQTYDWKMICIIGEIGIAMTMGDRVELADYMTRSRQ